MRYLDIISILSECDINNILESDLNVILYSINFVLLPDLPVIKFIIIYPINNFLRKLNQYVKIV